MRLKIVVIGANAAGAKAAAKAKRFNPNADVTVIERGEEISYGACGFPYFISDTVKDISELMTTPTGIVRDIQYFRNIKGVTVITRTEAVGIDRSTKNISLFEKNSGRIYTIDYDRLILATGSSAAIPPLENLCCPNIVTLKSPDDARNIKGKAIAGRAACIVGGGLIGLETAEALHMKGMKVTVVEMRDHLLPDIIDEDMALILEKRLKEKGIHFVTSSTVVGFDGTTRVERAITTRGEVPGDLVVLAPGVAPNITLAEECGLTIGETGAIAVDEQMRTSDPDIFACGDCCETVHQLTRKKIYHPLGSTAVKQGRVAGMNAAGGSTVFPGIIGTTIVKILEYTAARTGLNEAEASVQGHDFERVLVPSTDKAHFFPGAEHIILKLLVDRASRKILGAQAIGSGAADKRIDVAATAITLGATVDQLSQLDLAYAPPYSSALDSLIVAADVMKNKLAGDARGISPLEVRMKMERGDDFVLLDVRSPDEYIEGSLPDALRIPLGRLRQELNRLPSEREIIAFCKISLRGYEAQKILESAGFANCKFMDGGISAWPFELAGA